MGVGAGGDYSDFQAIHKILEEKITDDFTINDGVKISPRELHSYLVRVMYQRRSKGDPLWNSMVIAGKDFLGSIDKLGTNYEDNFVATGYGAHLALPILRKEYRSNLTKAEARQILEDAMRVLWYRDCRTINSIQFACVAADGPIVVDEPIELKANWEFLRDVQHGS